VRNLKRIKGEGHYSAGLAESGDYKDSLSAHSALTKDPLWGFAPSPPERGRDSFWGTNRFAGIGWIALLHR
jgi:hypothetical protein